MRLATSKDVLETLALQDRGSNMESANEGLEQVTPIIENVLGTSVFRMDREDLFCIDRLWQRNSGELFWDGNVKLLLEAGLVCEDGAIRVDLFANLSDVQTNTAGMRINKSEVFPFFEEGVIKTMAQIGDWVKIRYTAGFTEKNGTFEGVPNWLKRAAVSAAIRYMKGFQQKWNAKDIRDTKEEIHRLMEMHLTAKIRTKYGTFPYHTKELH